jgi:hypothetical protein
MSFVLYVFLLQRVGPKISIHHVQPKARLKHWQDANLPTEPMIRVESSFAIPDICLCLLIIAASVMVPAPQLRMRAVLRSSSIQLRLFSRDAANSCTTPSKPHSQVATGSIPTYSVM